jgi:hypothetical protein
MVNHNLQVRISLDVSNLPIDFGQSVEIVEHGAFHDEWTLSDPDADITVSGESYTEARRWLTRTREVKRRVERAATEQLDREVRSAFRDLSSVEMVA